MPDDPEVSPAPTEPPKKSKKLWVAIALTVVLGAGGIFLWTRPASPSSSKSVPEGNAGVESTLPLEAFVVNLKGGERAYLRVSITLALDHPLPKQHDDGAASVALIRDAILDVLTTASPEQLLQPEGKHQLKTELLDALNQRAPDLGIKDVFFTEFLVQV